MKSSDVEIMEALTFVYSTGNSVERLLNKDAVVVIVSLDEWRVLHKEALTKVGEILAKENAPE